MVIIILEKVPVSVRGELTRWMLELQAGVFIGNVSAMVREALWQMVIKQLKDGTGLIVHSAANEQGFAFRYCGPRSRVIEDFDGLSLVLKT